MTFYELVSFAKLFSRITSGDMTISDAEIEAAAKVLKGFGGNAPNWTPMQRELYKTLVNAAKEESRGHQHG